MTQQERIDSGVLMRHFNDPKLAQLVALFRQLDDRGQLTTLAMLATAVKLHPKVKA